MFPGQRRLSPAALLGLWEAFPPARPCPTSCFWIRKPRACPAVGTMAFQIGLGYFENGGFVVEQLLMRDTTRSPPCSGRRWPG